MGKLDVNGRHIILVRPSPHHLSRKPALIRATLPPPFDTVLLPSLLYNHCLCADGHVTLTAEPFSRDLGGAYSC